MPAFIPYLVYVAGAAALSYLASGCVKDTTIKPKHGTTSDVRDPSDSNPNQQFISRPISLKNQAHLMAGDTSFLGDQFTCQETVKSEVITPLPGYLVSKSKNCFRTLSPLAHLSGLQPKQFNTISIFHGLSVVLFRQDMRDISKHKNLETNNYAIGWTGEVLIEGQWRFVEVEDRGVLGSWDQDSITVYDAKEGKLDKGFKLTAWPGYSNSWPEGTWTHLTLPQTKKSDGPISERSIQNILGPVTAAYRSALKMVGIL